MTRRVTHALSLAAFPICVLFLLAGADSARGDGSPSTAMVFSESAASGTRPLRYSTPAGGTWAPAADVASGPFTAPGWPLHWKAAVGNAARDEIAVVFQEDYEVGRDRLWVSLWDGTRWHAGDGSASPALRLPSVNDATLPSDHRQFAAAHEQRSGELLVVSGINTMENVVYWTHSGTTWSGYTLTPITTGNLGVFDWVHLAAQPGTNRIAFVGIANEVGLSADGFAVSAAIWDGDTNTWGSKTYLGTNAAAGGVHRTDAAAVAFTLSGSNPGEVVAAWGDGPLVYARVWRPDAGWGSRVTVADFGAGRPVRWLRLAADPRSDDMVLALEYQDGAGASVATVPYDGATRTWGGTPSLHTRSAYGDALSNRPFDVAWDPSSERRVFVVYSDAAGVWSARSTDGGSTFEAPLPVDETRPAYWVEVAADAAGLLVAAAHDAADDLRAWAGDGLGWVGTTPTPVASSLETGATHDVQSFALARFTDARVSLTVTKAGSGTGTVSSLPAGISCGPACPSATAGYDAGASVVLTASADAASRFLGWDGEGCTGTGPCEVTVDGVLSVTATFEPRPLHLLQVEKSGTGAGTVASTPAGIQCGAECASGSALFHEGAVVILDASTGPRARFTGWSGACSGDGSCRVTMDGAKAVVAAFEEAEGADLVVAGLVLRPRPVAAGGAATIEVTVANRGDLDAAPGAVELWLSADEQLDSTDVRLGDAAAVDRVPPGGSTVVSVARPVPEDAIPGPWFLVVRADATDVVEESDETNNLAALPFRVAGELPVDFDGDGHTDLLWRHDVTGALEVWFLDGTVLAATSALRPESLADGRWEVRALADFDRDRRTDVLWRHRTTGELFAWFTDGSTVLGGAFLEPRRREGDDDRWTLRGAADFDGDGYPDLLWQEAGAGTLEVWLMEGLVRRAVERIAPDGPPDAHWEVRAAADFDGDGQPDLLGQSRTTSELSVCPTDGLALRSCVSLDPATLPAWKWEIALVTDVDSDGDPDIVLQRAPEGTLRAWIMDGVTLEVDEVFTPTGMPDAHWRVVPGTDWTPHKAP